MGLVGVVGIAPTFFKFTVLFCELICCKHSS
jgi:hypothetical protein